LSLAAKIEKEHGVKAVTIQGVSPPFYFLRHPSAFRFILSMKDLTQHEVTRTPVLKRTVKRLLKKPLRNLAASTSSSPMPFVPLILPLPTRKVLITP